MSESRLAGVRPSAAFIILTPFLWLVCFTGVNRWPPVAHAKHTGEVTFEQTERGFFYPLGTSHWPRTGGTWLGRDAQHDADGPRLLRRPVPPRRGHVMRRPRRFNFVC